jgi:hypothetical protein
MAGAHRPHWTATSTACTTVFEPRVNERDRRGTIAERAGIDGADQRQHAEPPPRVHLDTLHDCRTSV